MNLSNFNYPLPKELIAQSPVEPRDACKLLVLDRHNGKVEHRIFSDLGRILSPNDVLVFNQTKVFPARLKGHKLTGGKAEILLLQPINDHVWRALGRPNLKVGHTVNLDRQLLATVTKVLAEGEIEVEFSVGGDNLLNLIDQLGHTPLPPYIHPLVSESKLRHQYQTVYAKKTGSAAAPTAGLHFTQELLDRLADLDIQQEFVTLHVGIGTFKSLNESQLNSSRLHPEQYQIDPDTATRIKTAKKAGKRIVAVGTTTTRVLETFSTTDRLEGDTDLFIKPPYPFHLVDSMITNFHLPHSSLLMMISAFATSPNTAEPFSDFDTSSLGKAYQEAIDNKYRFFSFGDAMLII